MEERDLARFLSKTEVVDECWLWTAAATQGYGAFNLGGRIVRAHRISYEHYVGPIPEGAELDHVCRNRGCVNPAHLEAVTHAENLRRRPRQERCLRGHALEGAPVRNGARHCRQCALARNRAYRKRLRDKRPVRLCSCGEVALDFDPDTSEWLCRRCHMQRDGRLAALLGRNHAA